MAHLVQQAASSWAAGGRESLAQQLQTLNQAAPFDYPAAFELVTAVLRLYAAVPPSELASLLAASIDNAATAAPPTSQPPPQQQQQQEEDEFLSVLTAAIYTVDSALDDGILTASTPELKSTREADRQQWTAFCRALWATGIVPPAVYDRFEYAFLARVGATRGTADLLTRRNTRALTVKFYSLKKFNLLRESSEGYSLLLVLLHSEENLGPGKDPSTGWDIEPEEVRTRRARALWEKVQSVIGYFELDPNRALDVVLDAFLPHLLTHHRFFLSLLSCSPWAAPSPTSPATPVNAPDADLAGERGRSVVAQILGFKFRYYQGQDVMREGKQTPREMYLLAAVLVKEGFVRLQDLWSHLAPDEADVEKLEGQWRMGVNEKARSSKGNALLASAAPLVDDDAPAASSGADGEPAKEEEKTLPPLPPPQQKLPLVHALLVVGAHAHTAHLLGRLPHLPAADDEIADLVLRKLAFVLAPLLDAHRLPALAGFARPQANGLPQRAHKLTLTAPTPVATRERAFVGFYPEWSEGLQTVDSVEGLFEDKGDEGALTMLRLLGAQLGRRKDLLIRLVRIGRDVVKEDPDSKSQWDELLRLSFLPSLSLSGGCSSTSLEIWGLLSLYSLETRYGIYGFWRGQYATSLQLKVQGAIAERDAKAVLRRVSKDDIKPHARALGKLSHGDPLVLWSVVLRQIQSYENLVKPVVASAGYITPLGADTIVFSLLDAFSNPAKDRVKNDGTSTSLWLKALAAFAGELCRRHSGLIDSRPILHYVANQLRAGNPKDLAILRELVSAMAAVDPLANLNPNQVAALGGGALLRQEAIHPTKPTVKPPLAPGAVAPTEVITEKRGVTGRSAAMLLRRLKEDELILPLLVAIAQARESCVFNVPDEEAHMKQLSTLFDESTEVLLQYVDFLLQHLKTEEFAALLPSYAELSGRFGLSPALAFHILRPKLALDIRKHDAEKLAETNEAKEARLKQGMLERRKAAAAAAAATDSSPPPAQEVGSETTAIPAASAPVPSKSPAGPTMQLKYHETLVPLISSVVKSMPEACRPMIGAPFFVTFWQLSDYDLEVPLASYQREIDRLEKANADLGRFPTSAQTEQWRRERELLQSRSQALAKERAAQMESYPVTKRRLTLESAVWFRKATDYNTLNSQILQHCIFPRALLSLSDASYCSRFLRSMHTLGTTNFHSLWFYNQYVFTEWLAPLFGSFTENEARNYAHFLYDCLDGLTAWRKSEALYRKEAHGEDKLLPGFLAKPSKELKSKPPPIAQEDLLQWDGFRKVMHKWHSRFVKALELCLASGEYMHIKNVTIVLQKLLPLFPRERAQGAAVEAFVTKALASEQRNDLKLLLTSYSSQLRKLKPEWLAPSEIMNFQNPAASSSGVNGAAEAPAAAPTAEPATKAEAMDVDVVRSAPAPAAPVKTAPSPAAETSLASTRPPTPAVLSDDAAAQPAKAQNSEIASLRAKLQAASSASLSGAAPSGPKGSGARSPAGVPSGPKGQQVDGAPSGPKPKQPETNGKHPPDAPRAPEGTQSNGASSNEAPARPRSPVKSDGLPSRPSNGSVPKAAATGDAVKSALPARPTTGGAPSLTRSTTVGGNTAQLPPPPARQSSYPERRAASPPPPPPQQQKPPARRSPSPPRAPTRGRSPSPQGGRRRRANSAESTRSRHSSSAKDREAHERPRETDAERAERKARERDEDRDRRGDDRRGASRRESDRRRGDRDGRERERERERDLRGKPRDARDSRDDRRGDRGSRRPSPARDLRGVRDDRDRDRERDSRDPKRPRRDDDPRSTAGSGATSQRGPSPPPQRTRDPVPHMAPPRSTGPRQPPPSAPARRDRTPPHAPDRERAATPPLSILGSHRGLPAQGGAPQAPRGEPVRGGSLAARLNLHPANAPSAPSSASEPSRATEGDSRKRTASQRDDPPPSSGPSSSRRSTNSRPNRFSAINAHLQGGGSRR